MARPQEPQRAHASVAPRDEKLRGEGVCAYAGPCCYAPKRAVGVVALYFKPDIDQTKGGATMPFDSGALTEREPCLQPWAARVRAGTMSVDQCVDFVEKHSLPLAGWCAPFQSWLQHCYADPMRASLDARDWLLAAAALAHAGHEDAGKSLRQAAFDHLSSGDRESLLAAAERRLQQVLADSAPRSSLRACANKLRERQMQVRDSSPKAA